MLNVLYLFLYRSHLRIFSGVLLLFGLSQVSLAQTAGSVENEGAVPALLNRPKEISRSLVSAILLENYLRDPSLSSISKYPLVNLNGSGKWLGKGRADIYIVEGWDDFEDFPDCVCILTNGFKIGSGVLIGPNVVLTAQHDGMVEGNVVVSIGPHFESNTQNYSIPKEQIIKKDNFNPVTFENDLSLIILPAGVGVSRKPLNLGAAISAVEEVTVVGYGSNNYDGKGGAGVRRRVSVPLFRGDIRPFGADPAREFVALDSSPGGGADSCNGDSGGPAYVLLGGGYQIAGIVSRRAIPAKAGEPRSCGNGGVYVKINDEVWEWIKTSAVPKGGILDRN